VRSTHVFVLALAINVVAAAPASAAIRYTEPNGFSSGSCGQNAKCDFEWAVEGASNGDEILVGPGIYDVANQVVGPPFAELDIHGQRSGATVPRINFTGAGQLTAGGPSSRIRDLRFESGHAGFVVQTAGTIERVFSHTSGSGIGCMTSGKVLDSVCWSEGGRGVVASVGNVLIRNVTAYGGTYGVHAQASGAGKVSADVVNTIARGATKDLFAEGVNDQISGDLSATITVRHSNFQDYGVPDGNGNEVLIGPNNQTVDPQLVAPETGDFHESLSSPTRDRGEATPPGLDFEGEPRPVGASTDIGADESVAAPTANTLAATDITGTAATLRGTVDTGGASTEYRFELAATPLLGLTAAVGNLPAGVGSRPVSARVEGLTPDTTYYYRATATNAKGTSTGPTLTFVTPNTDTTAPILGGLRLSRSVFAVGRAFTPLSAVARGTVLSFRSSEGGSASITVQKAKPGRRRGRRCVPPRRARPGARRCTRWKTVVTLNRTVGTGTTRMPFSGRIGTRRLSRVLSPARYRFRVRIADKPGNRSEPAVIGFRVVRR
jgi:hypothetical protein